MADDQAPPLRLAPTNCLWKTPLPSGASSPCLWDDRVFLTAFSEGKLETLCLDRSDGIVRWRREAPLQRLETFHPRDGSPASATPATDGQRVVVYFGSCGLLCYDFSGKELWRLPLPVPEQVGGFGSGTSPVIAGDRVLLNRDQLSGSEFLAVDLHTGRVIWRADRAELSSSYTTPVLWERGGKREVVLAGCYQMRAYDLATGTERWRVQGLPVSVCPTPVIGDGLLFFAGWSPGGSDSPMPAFDTLTEQLDKDRDDAIAHHEAEGMIKGLFATFDLNRDARITRQEWQDVLKVISGGKNSLLAIRPGGQGDITTSHVAWERKRGLPYVASPLYYRGRIYLIKDGGLLSCFEAASGKEIFVQERIGASGSYYASPVAANGRIYVAALNGVVTVLAAGNRSEVLARASFGERIRATPALAGNHLYLRTENHLHAFNP